MADIRLERLTQLIVNYAAKVQPGDWVVLNGDMAVVPMLRALYRAALEAGGHPSLLMSDHTLTHLSLEQASDEQLTWADPVQSLVLEKANVFIRSAGVPNTRALTSIDPKRVQAQSSAGGPARQRMLERAAAGEFRWVTTLYPTEGWAQEANMSFSEYEDFVYHAAFCDQPDPAAAWLQQRDMQQRLIDWLKGRSDVRITGPNVDLMLSIADRTFVNSHGMHSISDGEIYTGPVEESVSGWVRIDFPSLAHGRLVDGISLRFDDGKVVDASARVNEEALLAELNTDAGARYLGEFAFGANFQITRHTGNVIFDEKIGGTVHVTLGTGYPETGSKNRSALHWDLISDLRKGGEVTVDGEVMLRDGKFLI